MTFYRKLKTVLGIKLVIGLLLLTDGASGQAVGEPVTRIYFKRNSTVLDGKAKRRLDSLAIVMRSDTTKGLALTLYYADFCDSCGVRAWKRRRTLVDFLLRKGISEERIYARSELTGERNFVTIDIVEWKKIPDDPLQQQHPNLRRKKVPGAVLRGG